MYLTGTRNWYFKGKCFVDYIFERKMRLDYGYFKGIGYEEKCTGIYR